jgi:catechol 2,3-dioxygenase-like lactoylglutathione lyase family enzyme
MPSNITLITLGVEGVAEATAFYERLGFVKSKRASEESVSFFKAGGVVLALWSREATRGWAGRRDLEWQWRHRRCTKCRKRGRGRCGNGKGQSRRRANLEASGQDLGGSNGYFADPDGHLWEVAFNPQWGLDKDGLIELPE